MKVEPVGNQELGGEDFNPATIEMTLMTSCDVERRHLGSRNSLRFAYCQENMVDKPINGIE